MTKTQKNKLLNLPIYNMMDWKFGLITREVYRISEKFFEIHDLSSGWLSAKVSKDKLEKILDGKISLQELNWK